MIWMSGSQFILKLAPLQNKKIIFAPLALSELNLFVMIIANINRCKSPQKNVTKNLINENKQNVCKNLNKIRNQVQKSLFDFSCLFISRSFLYRDCLLVKVMRKSFSTISNRFRYLFFK